MDCRNEHEEKLTLHVDVFIPGHDPRTETPLFRESRKALLERESARCFVCGCDESEVGPLEAHHWLIERCLARETDWHEFTRMVDRLQDLVAAAARFVAAHPEPPEDVMGFVDDMSANGMLLCKQHHTAIGTGIHTVPFPLWLAQVYGAAGTRFCASETIRHEEPPEAA